MASLEVIPVESRRDLDAFIDLPWTIYKDNSYWVPPLKKEVRKLLDTSRHPFWEFSEQALFLALRGSEPVGRIAGIIDRNFNQYHSTGMGAWGFFECVDDPEVARSLFDSVERWVCAHGMTIFRGPFNPSTNYEIGMLVEGFEHRPAFMMPYNHPYYIKLVEASGFRKEKDVVSFVGYKDSYRPPEWMSRLVERLKGEGRLHIRPLDMSRKWEEFSLAWELYQECWSGNWGFVPMSNGEFKEACNSLEKISDADLAFFVYWDNEPAAVALAVPDINPMLKRLNGKIGLLGLFKYLMYRKEIDGVRGLLFGVKDEYRERGLPFVALDHALGVLRDSNYKYIELGWNLEDNEAINQLEVQLGAKPYKRYRIFRKWFSDRW